MFRTLVFVRIIFGDSYIYTYLPPSYLYLPTYIQLTTCLPTKLLTYIHTFTQIHKYTHTYIHICIHASPHTYMPTLLINTSKYAYIHYLPYTIETCRNVRTVQECQLHIKTQVMLWSCLKPKKCYFLFQKSYLSH